jgi:hypothetical protein
MEVKIFEASNAKDLEDKVRGFLKPSTNVRHMTQSECITAGAGSPQVRYITLTILYTANA